MLIRFAQVKLHFGGAFNVHESVTGVVVHYVAIGREESIPVVEIPGRESLNVRVEEILTEDKVRRRTSDLPKEGVRDIGLTTDEVIDTIFSDRSTCEQQWNSETFLFLEGLIAREPVAMICRDDYQRVVPPGLAFQVTNEFTKTLVGVVARVKEKRFFVVAFMKGSMGTSKGS